MKRKPKSAPVSVATLTTKGVRLMASGRWRDAVQTYKQLVKQNPGGDFEPLLLEAYRKRAEELASKEMFKESLIILDNADRLVTKPQCATIRLTCLVALGHVEQAVTFYMREEAHIKDVYSDLFPMLREYIAALLLTERHTEHVLPTDSPWRAQLTIAQEALAAFCSPENTDLEPLLGRISLRSPFKPLRIILKALTSIHDQNNKANQLIASIDKTSPWAGMARFVILCTMTKDERLQNSGEFTQKELEMAFGWHGVLKETWCNTQTLLMTSPEQQIAMLLNLPSHASITDTSLRRAAFLLLVESPDALPSFEQRFGTLDVGEKIRLTALTKSRIHPDDALVAWQSYLRHLQTSPATAEQKLRLAMTHRFVAALILNEEPSNEEPSNKGPSNKERDDQEGITHLEQSLRYDSTHRKTHQALLAYYKDMGTDKDFRATLERTLRQFPDDADFLHEAVLQALQKKTFKKASRLAKRLLTIDPLHAEVRRDLIGACLAQARKQVQGGRVDLAKKELAEATTWEHPDKKDGVVRINQAFLAWLAQQTEEGNALLESGVQEAGGGLSARLRAVMESVRMNISPPIRARLKNDLVACVRLPVTHEAVTALVRVSNDYTDKSVDDSALKQMLTAISEVWTKAKNLPFPPEELRAICRVFVKTSMFGLLKQYAMVGEKKWKNQPVFVYYRLLAKYKGSSKAKVSVADQDQLAKLLRQAKEHKDHLLLQAIEAWLLEIEKEHGYGGGYGGRRRGRCDCGCEDGYEDDEDFMPMFLPRSASNPGKIEQDVLVTMMTAVAEMFMASQKGRITRREVRQLLIEFLEEAPVEIRGQLGNREALMSIVLDRLFPSPAGR